MWSRFAVLALLLSFAPERLARAEPAAPGNAVREAKALVDRGIAEYDRGRYARAIRLFVRAQSLAPSTRLLFNIGQAYAMLGDAGCADALAYFRRYRRQVEASGRPLPRTLAERIDQMQECVDRQKRGVEASPRDDGREAAEPFDATVEARQQAATGARARRRTAGWVVAGVGGAAIATAGVTGVLALQRQSELEDRCNEIGMCPEELDDEVAAYQRLRVTAFVSAAVGVSALAVGVWLIVTAPSEGARAATRAATGARVRPWFGPHGLGVSGEF